MNPGETVVFIDPNLDELRSDGTQVPMRILEIRGDRALVESLVDLPIRPTAVYPLSALKLATSCEHCSAAGGGCIVCKG